MNSVQEQAQAFFERTKNWDREVHGKELEALPQDVKEAFWKIRKASHFTPDKANLEKVKEAFSESGKYRLMFTPFQNGPGYWGYMQGEIFRVGEDTPIATVQRNYSAFPHLVIENHPSGHDFWVAGEDYQGQTVIDLTTGQRRDFLPKEAGKGHGFCWSARRFDPATQVLIVDGCYWACPYEYRFYDFSNPIEKGWPQLKLKGAEGEETYSDQDDCWPTIVDGVFTIFQSTDLSDYSDENKEVLRDVPHVAWTKFRREGDELRQVEFWCHPLEQKRREDREEADRKYEEAWALYKSTDPLYTEMTKLIDPTWGASAYCSTGFTHDKWCPDWKGSETRVCKDLVRRENLSVEMEIAKETGPVKLVIVKDKVVTHRFFMEHSVESIRAAIAHTKAVVEGGAP